MNYHIPKCFPHADTTLWCKTLRFPSNCIPSNAPDLPKKLVEEIMTLSVENSTSLKADIDKAIKAHLKDLET